MKKIAFLFPLLLGACATASHTYAPDGREAFSLDCSGSARSWGMCLEKAGDLCNTRGYEVMQASAEDGYIAAGNAGASISGNRAGFAGSGSSSFFASTLRMRTMLIACKKPA
ncbi:hypothetical protein BTHE68_71310 (plasmid) [Burkholderia sp. THE68]|uniref:hypothetical protein n=1 Tax=Burkholderia sp. THE68 TaxID=758782 RepID=UPI0013187539|nr:hypothetical protein [Burkholderia sp. THE68]BBU33397.1 hypothetical protein BTHE68_71310 [Burkholderia sp. THE68]